MGRFHIFVNGPGNGWWIGGAILTLIFWAAVIVLILAAIRHFSGGPHHHYQPPAASSSQNALDVLKMRFARGEIDEEEYKRRADLLSGH